MTVSDVFRRIAHNYLERHRNRASQCLHLLGIPLSFVVSVVFLIRHEWWWAGAAFLGGYVLQFVGHAIEGNDAGELIVIKKLLGKPYVEFGPGSKRSKCDD